MVCRRDHPFPDDDKESCMTAPTSTELALIPPRLMAQGVTLNDRDGYRTLGIPPAVRDAYNVIFPTVELSQSNPDFAPMLREISLSLDTDAYVGASFHKGDECSLGKNALLKLAEAAKVDIDTERIATSLLGPTERCGWKAIATQRHSDGTLTRTTSSAVFDNEAELAQITAQARNAADVPKRWTQKTLKASELTETIAIERALRAILKLPHKMKKAEFAKPWLVLCYGFVPQTPEARAEAARAMARLYGGPVDDSSPALAPAGASPLALPAAAEEPVFDDEPPVLDDADAEEGEVVEAAAVPTDGAAVPATEPEPDPAVQRAELERAAEAASAVKPPISGVQDFTLAQIAAKPNADKWFAWALAKDFAALDPPHPEFNGQVRAFCAVHFPQLLDETVAA
jgi:hypothetical protein